MKLNRKLRSLIAIVLLAGLVVAFIYGYRFYQAIYAPNVVVAGGEQALYIPSGADKGTVIQELHKAAVLRDMSSFEWLAEQKNYRGNNVVPGKYIIRDGMSNEELINHLRAGNGLEEVELRFNLIRTRAELAGRMAGQVEPDSISIYQWLTNSDSIAHFGFKSETIMSMFIPNTYKLNWAIGTPRLMRRMAREYKVFWNEDRKAKAGEIGLSQSEVVTLASIVYWETKKPKDMPVVAGVYMNRLRVGMPLQADPTLIFALGDFNIRRVLNKHKEIDSPYNTYKYKGLPPGPILIPPISYVEAVLNYSQHDFYYFVAKEDLSGDTHFSRNYKEHLIYARRYQRALNKRGILR